MVGGPERHWPTLCVEDRCGTGRLGRSAPSNRTSSNGSSHRFPQAPPCSSATARSSPSTIAGASSHSPIVALMPSRRPGWGSTTWMFAEQRRLRIHWRGRPRRPRAGSQWRAGDVLPGIPLSLASRTALVHAVCRAPARRGRRRRRASRHHRASPNRGRAASHARAPAEHPRPHPGARLRQGSGAALPPGEPALARCSASAATASGARRPRRCSRPRWPSNSRRTTIAH